MRLGAITLEHDELQELKAIEMILESKPQLKHNPLADISIDTLTKALNLLEEYSEEIKPKVP